MAYLNAIIKTIKQIQDSDEDTRDRYNYHRGLSLHMIKKLMGADHSQWGYINNALKSGVNKGKLIKTGGKYRVAVTKKKSRKLRKCKYGRDRTTGKCRKRRSVKRKTSLKRRSVKRKTSRKRRSVKRKTSRKRRSVKRKTSRKRRSVKRKTSRKRRSVKRKGNKKLKFRMITPRERSKIVAKGLTCPICLMDFEDVDNKDIVGCVGASEIPGWTCCSKTKKTGCKNSYFHKKCIETWVKRQESQHIPPSCPICRAEKPKKKQKRKRQLSRRQKLLGLTGLGLLGAGYQIGQGFMNDPNLERCYNPEIGSLGEGLPTCNGCNVVQSTSDGDLTWHYPRGPPGGVCPSYFDDSYANYWANWHARLGAEEWRKLEGIQAKVSPDTL